MCDPEALFLVDYHQAEIFELGLLRKDSVRADHDVDLTALQALARFLHFLGGNEPGKPADSQGEATETVCKILEVLACKKSGGGDHCNLLSVHRRHESGA